MVQSQIWVEQWPNFLGVTVTAYDFSTICCLIGQELAGLSFGQHENTFSQKKLCKEDKNSHSLLHRNLYNLEHPFIY